MLELSHILKANPYHDKAGRFTTKDKAHFVSTGPAFTKSLKRMKEAEAAAAKTEFRDYSNENWAGKELTRLTGDSQDQWEALSADEKKAVWNYTDSTFEALNKALGPDNKTYTDEDKAGIIMQHGDPLNSALRKMSATEDMVVYRAMNIARRTGHTKAAGGQNAKKEDLESLIGYEFEEQAFASSSVLGGLTEGRFLGPGRVMLRINVRKGKKGGFLGNDRERTGFPTESEFLFPTDTKFKIRGVSKKKRQIDDHEYYVYDVDTWD